jgi:hypothetical protein
MSELDEAPATPVELDEQSFSELEKMRIALESIEKRTAGWEQIVREFAETYGPLMLEILKNNSGDEAQKTA